MEIAKVVVRYADGKILKGFTQDFFPNKESFHLHPGASSAYEDAQLVMIKDLKAIFFVKDFQGNSSYRERRQFIEKDKPQGRKMEVIFKDGETLVGTTMGYDASRPGFFIQPVDGDGNNIRVFVVQASVAKVRHL